MGMLSVPLKTVLMYHADNTGETIPVSYEYCDGRLLGIGTHDIGGGVATYQLPDLRNRFILGADLTKGVGVVGGLTDSATDAPGPKGVGGLNGLTLITGNLPPHTHTGSTASAGTHSHAGTTTNTTGAHTHGGSTTDAQGNHNHTPFNGGDFATLDSAGGPGGYNFTVGGGSESRRSTTNTSGSHSHNLSITSDGGHSHTVTVTADGAHVHTFTTDATGSATPVDNRPRYFGLVFIMKVRN